MLLRALARREEALASYDRALALRSGYPEALCHRGNLLCELGKWSIKNSPINRFDPMIQWSREEGPEWRSAMGHGPALPSMDANGGYGSTAVHPVSCGNRQQWVDADLRRAGPISLLIQHRK